MKPRFAPPVSVTPYAGFIFDCDGTLADTMSPHFEAWRAALKEGGSNFEFTWSLFLSRAGMSMERTVQELSEEFQVKLDAELIAKRQREIFREVSREIAPIQEVLDFARSLHGKFPLSVASGSSRPSVERTLRQIGARDLFDVVITPEDVENGKPHPDMFLLAAEKMSVSANQCLVIEDGELGIKGARRAGMDCAIVQSPNPTAS